MRLCAIPSRWPAVIPELESSWSSFERMSPWKTAPMTATPSEPPIIRFIDRIPEATPALAFETAFIAAVDIGDITSAIPIPISTNDGQKLE